MESKPHFATGSAASGEVFQSSAKGDPVQVRSDIKDCRNAGGEAQGAQGACTALAGGSWTVDCKVRLELHQGRSRTILV